MGNYISVLGCKCVSYRDASIPISSKTLFTFYGSLTMSKRSGTGKSAKGKKKNKGHAAKGPEEVIPQVQSIVEAGIAFLFAFLLASRVCRGCGRLLHLVEKEGDVH